MGYSPNAITAVPVAPANGPRARTWKLLMEAASSLIEEGHTPTVAEVAKRAQVSRATAYRYFPTRSRLITAMVDTALGPVRSWSSSQSDGRARITELFESTFIRFKDFEPHMRAAAQLALEHQALERAGILEEEPYRRGHRIRILAHAVAPFSEQVPRKSIDRLQKALSIIYGIEPHIILKDIWGAKNKEVESIVFWMVDALIDATLKDAKVMAKSGGRRGASRRVNGSGG
ncbi:TetR/AcrR family transcriptional regulator [Bordetella genomosp. 9]|uniref:TetR family transcriptional regulator n=1 Tax=Bordetella genomosp. 9 TaxID=1416803 RepID=A0A1W6Z0W7_9BORD|nr:TetR/AcrR family transcriptional regulator [Bordetella genomosp. 9]ARP86834.1 TetR family transcriptional regulator [Bordetella genomosp. 9]